MQLAGPGVFGPPRDRDAALAVLRAAVGSRGQPYRHQRLLRPARHQPAHPRGAASLSGRSRHRHQGRRAARRRRLLDPGAHARRARRAPCTTICATSARCDGRREPARRRHPRPAEGSIEEQFADARRAAAPGPDPPSRPQQRDAWPDRARRSGIATGRLRAEPLQYRPSRRRRADRRAGRQRHRLCALLPARRLHARSSPRR